MHAIICQADGSYYISAVSGYYRDNEGINDVSSFYRDYWIIWNSNKKELIRWQIF